MQNNKIEAALVAANRMILAANEYLEKSSKTYTSNGHTFNLNAPKQSGALHRASMELTRALAEMRKP